jgi:two-component system, cell cycle sensor histidine kinase and response regulator CckA
MVKKQQWGVVLAMTMLHPLLLYVTFPLLGTSANAFSIAAPIFATLFFNLKVGFLFALVSVLSTALVFTRLVQISTVTGLSRSLVSFFVTLGVCIAADRLRLYLKQRASVETALVDRENQYRMVFENSAEGIICMDRDGVIIDANPQVKTHLGFSPDEIRGKRYDALGIFSAEGISTIRELIESQIPPEGRDLALQVKDKDQNTTSIDLSISYIKQKGNPTKWIGMLKNTTERRLMAAQLEQSKRMEAIGRLAGGISHDMNNILNAIMGSAFALRHELSNYDRCFEDLDNITSACERGSQLTRNLLGFARKNRFTRRAFSLNRVVESVTALLERTAPKNINLISELEDGLPLMEGDQGQTENAVMNLCLNAIDAMPDGGCLTLKTCCSADVVCISVSDTGSGIDDTIHEQVFEPFFTTKPPGKGTGLGLSMVYGVVKLHLGTIALESASGAGTMVTLTFPRTRATHHFRVETPFPLFPVESRDVLYGRTVLLVDDEPLVLRSGTRMLQILGCKVIGADSGKKALELFKTNRHTISFIILDLIMPEMDGVQTLEKLSAIDSEIPVLLASGYTPEAERIDQIRQQRSNCRFISKPYKPDTLVACAKKLLMTCEENRATVWKKVH